MELILIRHGQSQANTGESQDFDSALTPTGCEQSIVAANDISQIVTQSNEWIGYVSPFLRTLQSAIPIQAQLKIPFFTSWSIREIEHTLPPSEQSPVPKRRSGFDWVSNKEDGYWQYQKETRENFIARVDDFLVQLQSKHQQKFIVVSHGMTILALADLILHGTVSWPTKWVEQYPNGSVTHIKKGQIVSK